MKYPDPIHINTKKIVKNREIIMINTRLTIKNHHMTSKNTLIFLRYFFQCQTIKIPTFCKYKYFLVIESSTKLSDIIHILFITWDK